MEAFFLGLSSGTTCLAHCAPVIVPYFLSGGNSIRNNITSLFKFLFGRLIGYLIFGLIAWRIGIEISELPATADLIFGTTFLLLSILMAYSALTESKGQCTVKPIRHLLSHRLFQKSWLLTIMLGILTGINFCPPFLLAFSSTASHTSLPASLFYFFTFFLGTTLHSLPIAFLGVLKEKNHIRTIGRMLSSIMAAYFFYKGIFMILSCMV